MTIVRLTVSVALAAMVFAACTPARAQQTRAADLKTINDCLGAADKTDDLGTNCIGRISGTCMRKADNDVAKTKACAERELAVWITVSEAAGKLVRAGGFKDITKAVADSQRSWVQQRDALCPVFDKIEPGMVPGGAAYCRMQVTAQRALLLRRLGAAVNEH